jgi:hypothetical protein
MRSPITEHSLTLIIGLLMLFIILARRFIKAELISLLATFELTIIDSKYKRAFTFSFMVVLLAIAL